MHVKHMYVALLHTDTNIGWRLWWASLQKYNFSLQAT